MSLLESVVTVSHTVNKRKGKDAVVLRMELRRGAYFPFPGH